MFAHWCAAFASEAQISVLMSSHTLCTKRFHHGLLGKAHAEAMSLPHEVFQ